MGDSSQDSRPFDDMDEATASLIIKLQSEEVSSLQTSEKSQEKRLKIEVSDSHVAFETYWEELQSVATALSDRCMSRSLARAGDTDSQLLQELAAQEDAAANDRALAQRVNLTGDRALVASDRTSARTPPIQHHTSKIKLESPSLKTRETNVSVANQTSARPPPLQYSVSGDNGQSVAQQSGVADDAVSVTKPVDSHSNIFDQTRKEEMTAKQILDPLTGLEHHTVEGSKMRAVAETEHGEMAEPAKQSNNHVPKRKMCECIACSEEFLDSEVMHASCNHDYCKDCLNMLFKLATTNEANFPPTCCKQEITLESAKILLKPEHVSRYEEVNEELRTLDRTYCSNPTCSTFISPSDIDKKAATCVACGAKTCVDCKGRAHEKECPEDEIMQMTLKLAGEKQWQSCPKCHRLIELTIGCYHITSAMSAQKDGRIADALLLRWNDCWTEPKLSSTVKLTEPLDVHSNG